MIRLLIFFFSFALFSCSGQKPIAYTKLDSQTAFVGSEEEKLELVGSIEELASLREVIELRDDYFLKGLELQHQDLLVLHAGMRRSTGYSIEINNIELVGKVLTVHCTETAPGPNCFVGDALTYPTAFAVLDKGLKFTSLEIKKNLLTKDCKEN